MRAYSTLQAKDHSTMAQRAETTVAERFLTTCVLARISDIPGQYSQLLRRRWV